MLVQELVEIYLVPVFRQKLDIIQQTNYSPLRSLQSLNRRAYKIASSSTFTSVFLARNRFSLVPSDGYFSFDSDSYALGTEQNWSGSSLSSNLSAEWNVAVTQGEGRRQLFPNTQSGARHGYELFTPSLQVVISLPSNIN